MKKLTIKKFANGQETYVDLLTMILKQPIVGADGRPQPLDTDTVMKHLPILQQLKEIETPDVGVTYMLLEDEEHKTILDRVNKWQWGMANEDIGEFIRCVREAEDAPKPKPEAGEAAA